ncbi:TPA: restriction endonuclease subunit S [Staphylococcus aureus]|nr:restriction endonuclease subunit S [Staphylococcus aureus]
MSNTQKKNVPELRFPEFEGEWEERKLGDLIKVNSGKDYKHLDKGDIPVYGTGGYMTSVSEPLSEIDAVGIGRKGTINKPYLLEAPFWTVDTLFYCTPEKEADILFILSLFRKINWKLYDESTGVPSLSKQTINKINRLVPTNKEQQKIGEFFSKLDRQIELEEQKLELLQQQKKGYMQKIFSQELRFKDENGEDYSEWEERRFADIFKFHNKLRKPIKENLRVKGSYPYYGATGIIDYVDDFIFDGNYLLIGEDGANIITRSAPLVYLVNGKFWVNNHVHILSPLNGNIQYLYQVAELVNYEKYNTGTAQPKLNIQNLKIINVVISTNLEEQQKIGSFLSKLDRQIDLEEQKLELLQQRKKALLKSMFV